MTRTRVRVSFEPDERAAVLQLLKPAVPEDSDPSNPFVIVAVDDAKLSELRLFGHQVEPLETPNAQVKH